MYVQLNYSQTCSFRVNWLKQTSFIAFLVAALLETILLLLMRISYVFMKYPFPIRKQYYDHLQTKNLKIRLSKENPILDLGYGEIEIVSVSVEMEFLLCFAKDIGKRKEHKESFRGVFLLFHLRVKTRERYGNFSKIY